MATEAHVLADSVNDRGERLTSLEVTYPRFVLAEMISHRALSRSSASSRAIPVTRMLANVLENPVVPERFGANQSGMVAGVELDEVDQTLARDSWLMSRDMAVLGAMTLLGGVEAIKDESLRARLHTLRQQYDYQALPPGKPVHKEIANRLLENWMWATTIVTATDFGNFMALRTDRNAQPQIQTAALRMQEAMEDSQPTFKTNDEWHMPLIQPMDAAIATTHELVTSGRLSAMEMLKRMSVGRSARVSYLTHEGQRDPLKDLELHDRLLESGHMSPFEHVARPMTVDEIAVSAYAGNFRGWMQYRKGIPYENNFAEMQQYLAAERISA